MLCLVSLGMGCLSDAGGELHAEFSDGAAMVFEPTVCTSGRRDGFFGAALWTMHHELEIWQPRTSHPQLRFFDREDPEREIRVGAESCRQFDGELEQTSRVIDGIPAMQGELTVDCETDDGAALRGSVAFSRCSSVDRSGRPWAR